MKKSLSIAIIGAGIGGLVAAIGLRKKGFSPTIYEQASEIKPVGAGILLSINSMAALAKIDVDEALLKKGHPIDSFSIRNWNGEILSTSNFQSLIRKIGSPSVGIARSKLHEALINMVPSGSIHLGHSFESLSQTNGKTQIQFNGKNEADADIVIGADGLRSKVRKAVLGDFPLRYSGQGGWRGIAEISTKDFEGFFETWGIGNRFGVVPVSPNCAYWYSGINALMCTLEKDGAKAKALLLKLFGTWHSPIGKVIEATKPKNIFQTDIFDTPPTKKWFTGSVVMLGDAIHATTPNLGLGAGMAIESALVLAESIAKHDDAQEAFEAYQILRQNRTSWVTAQSLYIGKLAQLESPTMCRIRNAALIAAGRLIPSSLQERSAIKLLGYSVDFQ